MEDEVEKRIGIVVDEAAKVVEEEVEDEVDKRMGDVVEKAEKVVVEEVEDEVAKMVGKVVDKAERGFSLNAPAWIIRNTFVELVDSDDASHFGLRRSSSDSELLRSATSLHTFPSDAGERVVVEEVEDEREAADEELAKALAEREAADEDDAKAKAETEAADKELIPQAELIPQPETKRAPN